MNDKWHGACRQFLQDARNAVEWVNDAGNQSTLGLERKPVDKTLRRLVTEAAKLERSVDRPMCVGIFGPSQAGKSYLVSVLASGTGRSLRARFAGLAEPLGFLEDINPGGERESTGVVTRFSRHDKPSPPGFPVCLRLLSETDIIKILGNSFFLDGDPKKLAPLDPEELRAILATARAAMNRARPADNRLVVDDVWDLQEYFERTFEGTRGIETLRSYWDEAAEIAPALILADRAALFAPLWGRLDRFTAIYRELVSALAQLGFAQEAFCPLEALVPRTASIIDVQTLDGLGKAGQPELMIRAAEGAPVGLPRPIVTALVAELHITMTEQPWPFLAHTDLLDFPGARGRQPLDLKEFLEDSARNPLKETVLRGKVAYLFERYVAEQELTSMLLCIKPSTQEVTDLPDMINRWIALTHGATPQQRVGKAVALYLVLTWFDTHFVEKAGEEKADPGDRFKGRLFASVESFFAKAHEWPTQWTPGQAFNNVYWFRNPSYPAEAIIEYDGSRGEVRLRPDREDYVDRLFQGYLQVPAVQRFFRDPAAAFQAGLKLNDGGVSYLAENLETVCRPEVKVAQTAARLTTLARQLQDLLGRFHVSSDVEARLAERGAVSLQILEHIRRLGGEGRFADLLTALQISQHGYSDVLYDVYTRRSRESAPAITPPSAQTPPARPMPGLPPLPGLPALASLPPLPGMPQKTTAASSAGSAVSRGLARAAVEHWLNSLRSASETEGLSALFLGDTHLVTEMINEFSQAARRTGLEREVLAAIEKLNGNISEEIDITLEKAAFASSTVINRFVSRFYFERVAMNERPFAPDAQGEMAPIFSHPPAADSARNLPLAPSLQSYEALSHWMYALHRLIEDNATSVDGMDIDVERNAVLGAILTRVAALGVRAAGSV